ncbi:class I SAM-dependent methyltransferase [Bacteriovoracaceae bacterium]|nr:class I SAM-dependent methyltransferase [Bacteriovoracaceae bacterium]
MKTNEQSNSELSIKFDYDGIPAGYYDEIYHHGTPIRKAWHFLKFQRILEGIPRKVESIIDIGSAAGTFLGQIPKTTIPEQWGIDISLPQVKYANSKYETDFRRYHQVDLMDKAQCEQLLPKKVDCVSCIEVIEHLEWDVINEIFGRAWEMLNVGGTFILSTPNYLSSWPVLEFIVNKLSSVDYEDQHITKFQYFNIINKLSKNIPDFKNKFDVDYVTTSHLLMPFTAGLSYKWSVSCSRVYHHRSWKFPFGNLIICALTKRG